MFGPLICIAMFVFTFCARALYRRSSSSENNNNNNNKNNNSNDNYYDENNMQGYDENGYNNGEDNKPYSAYRDWYANYMRTFHALWTQAFMTIATTAISSLHCIPISSTTSVVSTYPNIICQDETYKALLPPIAFALVIVCVMPITYLLILIYNKKIIFDEKPKNEFLHFQENFGTL